MFRAPRPLIADEENERRSARVSAWSGSRQHVDDPVRVSESERFADQGTMLELRALTVGQAYWVAIESFDESGVSTMSSAVQIGEG